MLAENFSHRKLMSQPPKMCPRQKFLVDNTDKGILILQEITSVQYLFLYSSNPSCHEATYFEQGHYCFSCHGNKFDNP